MNASLSYDPDVGVGNHSGMSFTWHYGEIISNHSGLQRERKDVFAGVNESTIHYSGNAFGVQIILHTAAMSLNKTFIVKLVVTKDCRSASVYQIINLVEGDPPEISQR